MVLLSGQTRKHTMDIIVIIIKTFHQWPMDIDELPVIRTTRKRDDWNTMTVNVLTGWSEIV